MRRILARWLISLTLAGLAFVTLTAELGIREDELRCEEAKQHLIDCCGTYYQYLDCHYVSGCGGTQLPALDVQQAVCLRDKSCSDLQSLGCASLESAVCE